jgi:hypothetical protein
VLRYARRRVPSARRGPLAHRVRSRNRVRVVRGLRSHDRSRNWPPLRGGCGRDRDHVGGIVDPLVVLSCCPEVSSGVDAVTIYIVIASLTTCHDWTWQLFAIIRMRVRTSWSTSAPAIPRHPDDVLSIELPNAMIDEIAYRSGNDKTQEARKQPGLARVRPPHAEAGTARFYGLVGLVEASQGGASQTSIATSPSPSSTKSARRCGSGIFETRPRELSGHAARRHSCSDIRDRRTDADVRPRWTSNRPEQRRSSRVSTPNLSTP